MIDQETIDQIQLATLELMARGLAWDEMYQAIFGPGGLIRTHVSHAYSPTRLLQRREYESSQAYLRLLAMLATVRSDRPAAQPTSSVITVRMPRSMHVVLVSEAHEHETSLNQLAISKLLLPIRPELVSRRSLAGSKWSTGMRVEG